MQTVEYSYSENGLKSMINTDSELSFITLILKLYYFIR